MARELSHQVRKHLIAGVLGAGAIGSLAASVFVSTPARAIIVFDPSNYSQNILTAARTLDQINNQVRMLQNQAQSLLNQAKNLTTISFPEFDALRQTMSQIDRLMGQARGIQFQVAALDQQFARLYPGGLDQALRGHQLAIAARERLDTSVQAYRQTMSVQAQVVENVAADAQVLSEIVARSQTAQGALQVGQATNQLLALAAKQQFQLQSLLASQYRAEAMEQARRMQAEGDARTSTAKFIGSGSAYTPR